VEKHARTLNHFPHFAEIDKTILSNKAVIGHPWL